MSALIDNNVPKLDSKTNFNDLIQIEPDPALASSTTVRFALPRFDTSEFGFADFITVCGLTYEITDPSGRGVVTKGDPLTDTNGVIYPTIVVRSTDLKDGEKSLFANSFITTYGFGLKVKFTNFPTMVFTYADFKTSNDQPLHIRLQD